MAKQSVSWIELHLEKFVLGLTAVVFLGALVLFAFSTPNTVDVDGAQVGPTELDKKKVRDQAKALASALRGEPPKIDPVADSAGDWTREQNDLIATARVERMVRPTTPFGPNVPDYPSIPLPGETESETGLARVLAPSKPGVAVGRSTIYRLEERVGLDQEPPELPEGEDEEFIPASVAKADMSWISVGATFDLQAQRSAFFNAGYDARDTSVVFFDVQAQRQTRQPDGSWSDWEDIVPYYPYVPWVEPEVNFTRIRPGAPPRLAGEQSQALRNFQQLVREFQPELKMPFFAQRLKGDEWTLPKLADADWDEIIDEYEFKMDDTWPYPKPTKAVAKATDEFAGMTPAKRIKAQMEKAEDLAKAPLSDRSYEELREARTLLTTVINDGETPSFRKRKAQELLDEIEPYYREKLEKVREEEFKRDQQMENEEEADPLAEDQAKQAAIWLHDIGMTPRGDFAPNNPGLTPGAVYRYRLRVRLLNLKAGSLEKAGSQEAAEQVLLVGAWSPPSDPITATRDKEIFVASVNPQQKRAQVYVYLRLEGEHYNQKFTVGLGEEIGKERVREKIGDKTEFVDYRTGFKLVEIEPARTAYRKKDRGDGFDLSPTETQGVILASDDGVLIERLAFEDKEARDEYRKAIGDEKEVKVRRRPPKRDSGGPGSSGPGGGRGGGRGGGGMGGSGPR